MWVIHRNIATDRLPDGETVLCFTFQDLDKYKSWWLVIEGREVDLCTEDPGKDVDLYVTSELRTLIEVWQRSDPTKSWTDEAALLESVGIPVRAVLARQPNPKVTTEADLRIMRAMVESAR